jgi:hypothetical protein
MSSSALQTSVDTPAVSPKQQPRDERSDRIFSLLKGAAGTAVLYIEIWDRFIFDLDGIYVGELASLAKNSSAENKFVPFAVIDGVSTLEDTRQYFPVPHR